MQVRRSPNMRGAERLTTDGELTKRLSIGVLPTAATDLVPRAAMAFREEMPHVRLRIRLDQIGYF